GSTLLGRVLDADTGTGVADAQIEAWMGTRSIHAETDGEGRFRFEGLAPGSRITIWITATTKYVQERIDLAVPGGSGGNFNTNFKLLPRSANAGRSGGIGVFLNRRGGKTVITGLDAFGPAERAGVQIGDTIVAVGNRQTADLGPGAIEYLLRGAIGGDVEITVAGKSGAPRKLSLKRTGR
ncbi:MAG TPA: PDZ domain-containing protein, partial [Polyangia bacterium]